MKPEIKKLWVDALRSGQYQQCNLILFNGEGFCCLGVLCDLYLNSEDNDNSQWNEYFEYDYGGEDTESDDLPDEVMHWAGLSSRNPVIAKNYFSEADLSAVAANDDENLSFERIADLIEENL